MPEKNINTPDENINQIFEEADKQIQEQNSAIFIEEEKRKFPWKIIVVILTLLILLVGSLVAGGAIVSYTQYVYQTEIVSKIQASYIQQLVDIRTGKYDDPDNPAKTNLMHGIADLLTDEDIKASMAEMSDLSSITTLLSASSSSDSDPLSFDIGVPAEKEEAFKKLVEAYEKELAEQEDGYLILDPDGEILETVTVEEETERETE